MEQVCFHTVLVCIGFKLDSGTLTNWRNLVYRLNTYPIIHTGFFHALLNALALTPLLERFEAEHGTLTSIALFVGRKFRSVPF